MWGNRRFLLLPLLLAPMAALGAEDSDGDSGLPSGLTFLTDEEVTTLKGDMEALRQQMEEHHKPEPPVEDGITLGGALRFNYLFRDWNEEDKDTGGRLDFDTFRLNLDGQINNIILSAEYRFYSFMQVLHHGWIGYNATDDLQLQLGVSRVPFGIQPYASHSYWFGLPYFIGLEDDYDLGLKTVYERGNFSMDLAFYKNSEPGFEGDTNRYSFDVVERNNPNTPNDQFNNEENNQVNLQTRYTFDFGGGNTTEVGLSGQWGQLHNSFTGENGSQWAAAGHINALYGNWNLMLEGGRYEYHPKNPPGVSGDEILIGGFGADFPLASEGNFGVANLAYDIPFKLGPITGITVYENFSILDKDTGESDDSVLNVVGARVDASPVFAYIDVIQGKNMPFLGAQGFGPPVRTTNVDDGNFNTRFNINIGYYF